MLHQFIAAVMISKAYISARRDQYNTVKCVHVIWCQTGRMEKADDDDDLIGKHMTVHIKWPLLMFAADTPKSLQENNNLRVSV